MVYGLRAGIFFVALAKFISSSWAVLLARAVRSSSHCHTDASRHSSLPLATGIGFVKLQAPRHSGDFGGFCGIGNMGA